MRSTVPKNPAVSRKRRWWRWPPIGVLLTYALASCTLYGVQRSLVFQPRAGADFGQAQAVGMTAITTTAADGVTVSHWYSAPGREPTVVVLFHGNGGTVADLEPWAAAFRARGYGVLLADYRGYSGNPGAPSEPGVYADARAVLAWLATQGFDDRKVVLLGWSLGSGVAVQMAVEHHPKALVLLAPYTSLVDVAARAYPIFPVRALMVDRFDSISKIAKVEAPLLVVNGAEDDVIPPDMGWTLLAQAREPKRGLFLDYAGHVILPEQAFNEVAAFVANPASLEANLPAH